MGSRNIKYNTLTIKNKLNAIKEIENGNAVKDVAKKYGVPPNTMSTILKNKEKIRSSIIQTPGLLTRKRLRRGKFEKVDRAVEHFITEARGNHVPINGKMIQDKAKQFGQAFNCNSFTASNGWFNRLKMRTGLK